MTETAFVLSASPVSRAFRDRIESEVGAPVEVLNLAQLRRLPLPSMLRILHAQRGRTALLAIEDETSASILPVLHAVAAVARPSSVELVRSDLVRERRTVSQLVAGLGKLVRATASGVLAARAVRSELARLARDERRPLGPRNHQRVLYLNTNMWFGIKAGGSVGHIAGVVNGFLDHGVSVDLASSTDPALVRSEARFHRLRPPSTFALPLELNFPRFQRRVLRDLLDRGADDYGFLYQRLSVANHAGVVLSRAFSIPLVVEYNGSEVWAARNWGQPLRYESTALQAEEVCLRHAHLVVTISEVLRDELVARGVEPGRVVWYPNGVDPERYHPDVDSDVRARLGIADDAVVLGFIGTFGQWHGVDVLAHAVARLIREDEQWMRDRRVHVLLVGDGYRMPDVREALPRNAEEFVTLTGLVPQADGPRYLAAADVLVSPHVPNADGSPFFGSPTKLFEYMAMGRPILASDLQQIGDVLQPALHVRTLPDAAPTGDDPFVALLATPGSVDELVRGLRFLVEQQAWRRRLGVNARARVLERHTWSHHVGVILEALRHAGSG